MTLSPRELEADLLKVLGHPARLQIVEILAREETCVCDLIPQVGLEQSNLSQHLKLLRKHGVVEARRDGSRVIYRLVNRSVVKLITAAGEAVQEHLERVSAIAASRR
ncbi:MAG: ArsR/SmtB family transcription factor [Bacillota bacterium]